MLNELSTSGVWRETDRQTDRESVRQTDRDRQTERIIRSSLNHEAKS